MIRVGIAGLGYISQLHLDAYARSVSAAKVVAASDVDPIRRSYLPRKYGIHDVFSDFREMIEQRNIDAIDVCLPPNLHSECIIEAARHGLHVFSEKPLATTESLGKAAVEAVRKSGVNFMIGFLRRFHPAYNRARELLKTGAIGNVYACDFFSTVVGPSAPWYFDPEVSGGGCLADLGSHFVDLCSWFFGPVEPMAHRSKKLFPLRNVSTLLGESVIRNERVEDFSVLLAESGEASASITSGWFPKEFPSMIEKQTIYGTTGAVQVDVGISPPVVSLWKGDAKSHIEKMPFDWKELFSIELQEFVSSIMEKRVSSIPLSDAESSLQVVLKAYQLP